MQPTISTTAAEWACLLAELDACMGICAYNPHVAEAIWQHLPKETRSDFRDKLCGFRGKRTLGTSWVIAPQGRRSSPSSSLYKRGFYRQALETGITPRKRRLAIVRARLPDLLPLRLVRQVN